MCLCIAAITINAQTPLYVITGNGSGSYEEGELVTLIADPTPEGHRFKEWIITPSVTFLDDTDETFEQVKFIMPAKRSLCHSRV
ncbi:MAG: hypothetical protein FWE63_05045 [Bacteroidales bacterium]|nr:hypothetical protein [Bacteroidales bacterium]